MDIYTRERAYQALMSEEKLIRNYHIPFVYVVGSKIFTMLYAAKAWNEQVCPKEKIEVISILQAYGVASKDDLPKEVKVKWNFESTNINQ